jgi:transposase-like protein
MTTEDLACPNCHEAKLILRGMVRGKQRYECKACHFVTTKPISSDITPRIEKSVSKVLESTRITKVKEND